VRQAAKAGTKIEIAYDVDYTEMQPNQNVIKYHQTRTYDSGGREVHFTPSDIGHSNNKLGQIGVGNLKVTKNSSGQL
jgi:hypothetical protein